MKRKVLFFLFIFIFIITVITCKFIKKVTSNTMKLEELFSKNKQFLSITDLQINQLKKCGKTGDGVKISMIDSCIITDEIKVMDTISIVTDNNPMDNKITHATISALILKREISPNVELYSIEAINSFGVGTYADIIKGIEWSIENDMDIIMFSFIGYEYSKELHKAIQSAGHNDIVLIAAAGNNSSDIPVYPAAFPEVISVGSLNCEDRIADYSNFGQYVNVYAPGEMKEYETQGTSFSVPYVAGFISLFKENSSITNREILDFFITNNQ